MTNQTATGFSLFWKRLQRHKITRWCASLQLAVSSMAILAVILAIGTIVESRYNAEMARMLLYDQWYFHVLLVVLFINILFAVLVRWPLRPIQYGFGVTHLGMLLLLVGSVLTQKFGIDGSMRLEEGTSSMAVRLPELVVRSYQNGQLQGEAPVERTLWQRTSLTQEVPGVPNAVVRQYLPFSRQYSFVRATPSGEPVLEAALLTVPDQAPLSFRLGLGKNGPDSSRSLGLLQVHVERVRSSQEFLSAKAPHARWFRVQLRVDSALLDLPSAELQAGKEFSIAGARIKVLEYFPDASLEPRGLVARSDSLRNPVVRLQVTYGDSSWQEVLYGRLPEFRFSGTQHSKLLWSVQFQEDVPSDSGVHLRFGVMGDSLFARVEQRGAVLDAFRVKVGEQKRLPIGVLQLMVGRWEPRAQILDSCAPVDPAPGKELPLPAISVSQGPWGGERWIPLNGWFAWTQAAQEWILAFEDRRVSLPFAIRLDKFVMGTDPGTNQAASYQSHVSILDTTGVWLDSAIIRMNEPLKYAGFTFYQSSFTMEPGTQTASVLSVNRDPGRALKYLGSLIMILGIVWYTLARSRLRKKEDSV